MPHPIIRQGLSHRDKNAQHVHIDSLRTNKRNFHHMFLVSNSRTTSVMDKKRSKKKARSYRHALHELQSLSAKLDIHMMINTSFERDCLAKGSIPVARKCQFIQSRKQHQAPMCRKAVWPHRSGATPPLPLKKWQEDHCKCTSSILYGQRDFFVDKFVAVVMLLPTVLVACSVGYWQEECGGDPPEFFLDDHALDCSLRSLGFE
jgi:hypothetical protein